MKRNSTYPKGKSIYYILTVASVFLMVYTLPAYAYIDPGTGSLVIQSVIGAIAAIGLTIKLYWHKIKLKFSGRKLEKNSSNKANEHEIGE